jgi:ArsR family transcriptional regulator, arsenate/arsenite/antimonite-responsive transcriptional repressor
MRSSAFDQHRNVGSLTCRALPTARFRRLLRAHCIEHLFCHELLLHICQKEYILAEYIRQCEYNRFMAARQKPFNIERFFQALGDNTRLRLLNLMGDQEICVCYFVEILDQPQPKISRHLAYLRNAGIVTTRRDGKWMHYRIVMPPNDGAAKVLREILEWFKEEKTMQSDRAKLSKACCAPERSVTLQGAPLPAPIETSAIFATR